MSHFLHITERWLLYPVFLSIIFWFPYVPDQVCSGVRLHPLNVLILRLPLMLHINMSICILLKQHQVLRCSSALWKPLCTALINVAMMHFGIPSEQCCNGAIAWSWMLCVDPQDCDCTWCPWWELPVGSQAPPTTESTLPQGLWSLTVPGTGEHPSIWASTLISDLKSFLWDINLMPGTTLPFAILFFSFAQLYLR